MVTDAEKNRFPDIPEYKLKKIEELYSQGNSRDSISQQIGLGHRKTQEVINYLKSTVIEEEHKKALSEKERTIIKNKDREYYDNIKQDYLTGNSIHNIKKKYHIGTSELYDLINTYSPEEQDLHKELSIKENIKSGIQTKRKEKDINYYNNFFGRPIENLHGKLYCRIVLKNKITLEENYKEFDLAYRHRAIHTTNFLTYMIKGKGDAEKVADALRINGNNVNYEESFCRDFSIKENYNILELLNAMGIDVY